MLYILLEYFNLIPIKSMIRSLRSVPYIVLYIILRKGIIMMVLIIIITIKIEKKKRWAHIIRRSKKIRRRRTRHIFTYLLYVTTFNKWWDEEVELNSSITLLTISSIYSLSVGIFMFFYYSCGPIIITIILLINHIIYV